MKKKIILGGFEKYNKDDLLEYFPKVKFLRLSHESDADFDRNFGTFPSNKHFLFESYKFYSQSEVDENIFSFLNSEQYKNFSKRALIASSRGSRAEFPNNIQIAMESNNSVLFYVNDILSKEDYKSIYMIIFSFTPHTVIDWAIYYLLRFHKINCFSLNPLPNSELSLVYKNILDNLDNRVAIKPIKLDFDFDRNNDSNLDFSEVYKFGKFNKPNYMKYNENRFPEVGLNKKFFIRFFIQTYQGLKILIKQYYIFIFKKNLKNKTRKLFRSPYSINQLFSRFLILRTSNLTDKCKTLKIDNLINSKFVYIPLHVQPESSSETTGDIYIDQLLFIKQIRFIIPGDWNILVKRNPLDSTPYSYLRHQAYWESITKIKNTFIIDSKTESRLLIEKSLLVSSVSGTACFEANLISKPSIYGGDSNFSNSPLSTKIYKIQNQVEFLNWFNSIENLSFKEKGKLMNDFLNELNYKAVPGEHHYKSIYSKKRNLKWFSQILNSCK